MLSEQTTLKLQSHLTAIEKQYNITIVTAWLGGSHAWNVASTDSDYDVYFVYTQPLTDYALIDGYESSYDFSGEHVTDGVPPQFHLPDVEFVGWDLRHFGELLLESNPTPIEVLVAGHPIKTHPVIPELSEYVTTHFHNINLYQHYHSLTKSQYNQYLKDRKQPTLKRTLYVLRGALTAEYIRTEQSFPPLELPELADAAHKFAPSSTVTVFQDLIKQKQNGERTSNVEPQINTVEPFIRSVLNREVGSSEFNHQKHIPDETMDSSQLDSYLLQIITGTTV